MDLFYTSYPASFFPAGWMTKSNFDSASAGFLTFKSRKSSCGLRLKPPQDVGNRSFQGFRPILRRKTLLEWPAALTGWNELTKEVLFVSGITERILKPTTIFQPLNRKQDIGQNHLDNFIQHCLHLDQVCQLFHGQKFYNCLSTLRQVSYTDLKTSVLLLVLNVWNILYT